MLTPSKLKPPRTAGGLLPVYLANLVTVRLSSESVGERSKLFDATEDDGAIFQHGFNVIALLETTV